MKEEIKHNCKIHSHIPREDGRECECGYFREKPFLNYLIGLEEGVKKSCKKDLNTVLDFIERWNKQDEDKNVAEAATRLSSWVNSDKSIHGI